MIRTISRSFILGAWPDTCLYTDQPIGPITPVDSGINVRCGHHLTSPRLASIPHKIIDSWNTDARHTPTLRATIS